jgi:hypothetical protein
VIPAGRPTAKAAGKGTFIDQERRLGDPKRLDTVVVPTVNPADAGSGVCDPFAGARGEIRDETKGAPVKAKEDRNV